LSLTDFQNFQGPGALFQDFPVLENATVKFQDFPGFPGSVQTLILLISNQIKITLFAAQDLIPISKSVLNPHT